MKTVLMILAISGAAVLSAASVFDPISREEATRGERMSVTGVVTCVAYWQKNSFVMADPQNPNGSALYVTGEHPTSPSTPVTGGPLAVGDLVAVAGERVPMFFAPGVSATKIVRVGVLTLPEVAEGRLADFAGGRRDNQRTAFRGVIHEVSEVSTNQASFRLFTSDGPVEVRIPVGASAIRRLVDAEVVARGVAMSVFNQRAEFLSVRLEVSSIQDIRQVEAPCSSPFDLAVTPLDSLLSWTPSGDDGHVRRVVGVVTARERPSVFYLQNGTIGVRVSVAEGGLPDLGTLVTVVGFPELVGTVGEIRSAQWRICSRGDADIVARPAPRPLTARNLLLMFDFNGDNTYDDFDCQLTSVEGRLGSGGGGELLLEVDGQAVRLLPDGPLPEHLLEAIVDRPLASVVGVARLKIAPIAAGGRRMEIIGLTVRLRTPSDITLIPDEAWRLARLKRMWQSVLSGLFVFVGLLVVALAFMVARDRRRKREAAILSADRKRIAGDLHDTIEQHLAGAKILLSTALNVPGGMKPEAESAVTVAADVLMEAKHQIRDVILNLRNEELMQKPLDELLKSVAESVNRQGGVRVRVSLRGIPESLSAGVKTDLVAIVQQAITNAVKHGKARTVIVAADPGFRLRIANDGIPFDPDGALGPDTGHFGLSSMRERAKRSGFRFSLSVEGKWTIVKLEES